MNAEFSQLHRGNFGNSHDSSFSQTPYAVCHLSAKNRKTFSVQSSVTSHQLSIPVLVHVTIISCLDYCSSTLTSHLVFVLPPTIYLDTVGRVILLKHTHTLSFFASIPSGASYLCGKALCCPVSFPTCDVYSTTILTSLNVSLCSVPEISFCKDPRHPPAQSHCPGCAFGQKCPSSVCLWALSLTSSRFPQTSPSQ